MTSILERIRSMALARPGPAVLPAPAPSPRPPPASRAVPYEDRSDTRRVVELPVVDDLIQGRDDAELDAISRRYLLAKPYQEGFRLFPEQANAMRRLEMSYGEFEEGGFFPIGVGFGKTGLSLMISNYLYTHPERPLKHIGLVIPPNLTTQLVETDIPFWRARTPIQFPVRVLSGRSQSERMQRALLRSPGLYVLSYSQISAKHGEDLLEALDLDAIVMDEAQNVSEKGHSARSSRFFRVTGRKRPAMFAMSGTMTDKSPMDYHRLSELCLGRINFMPNSSALAVEWAALMDADSTKEADEYLGVRAAPVFPLLKWAMEHRNLSLEPTPTDVRRAFQARMASSPGVYSSAGARIPVEMGLRQRRIDPLSLQGYPGWDEVLRLKDKVELEWLTPNGDEIEHAIHTYKWLAEICGAGFYNQLAWPSPEKLSHRRGISEGEAEDVLAKAKEHHEAGQRYARDLRDYLSRRSVKGLDTPMLVGNEFRLHGADSLPRERGMYEKWLEWKELDFEGRPERDGTAVFLCDFKLVALLELLADIPSGEGCTVFYENIAVGQWAYQYVKEAGFDCMHCPAGDPYNDMIDGSKHPENKSKIIIASRRGHGVGKNLQYHHHQIYLQWPRSAKDAEQALGRFHRNGQTRSRIEAWTIFCDRWDDVNFAATLNDALYIQQSMGTGQKLIGADYDPLPVIFPSAVLQEMGAQAQRLTAPMEQAMQAKFGRFGK